MVDTKYGKLYTEHEVHSLMLQAAGLGASCIMSKPGAEEIVMPTEEISTGVESLILDHEGKFGDEPIFVLRAQDVYAPDTIAFYISRCEDDPNVSDEHVTNAATAREQFRHWQSENTDRVKIPD